MSRDRVLWPAALLSSIALAGSANAATVTLLATGTVVPYVGSYPAGSLDGQQLKVGDIMQLEYTIDPSIPSTVDGGPIVALSYSFNGAPFVDFYGTEFGDSVSVVAGSSYGFGLQPSHGQEVYLNVALGQGADAGIIPTSNLDVIPNWSLVAGAPTGSVTATMFIEDLAGDGAEANITNIKQVNPVPLPPTVWLMLPALGGLAGLARKRNDSRQ